MHAFGIFTVFSLVMMITNVADGAAASGKYHIPVILVAHTIASIILKMR